MIGSESAPALPRSFAYAVSTPFWRARVAELADGEAGVGRLRGGDRVQDRLDLVDRIVLVAFDGEGDERGVAILCDRAAMDVLHVGDAGDARDDVRHRCGEGRRPCAGGAALDQDAFVGRLLEAVV